MTRRMIEQYLQNRSRTSNAFVLLNPDASFALHLDEDILATFTEGRLTQVEAAPFVSHLVACAMCRHKLAGLLRLDNENVFDDLAVRNNGSFDEATGVPSRIRNLLNELAARFTPFTDEQTVFGYQEETEQKDEANSEEPVTR